MLFPKSVGNTAIESFTFQHILYIFPSALIGAVDGMFVLQNTLYIVFHVICMLFTYANNLARCIK